MAGLDPAIHDLTYAVASKAWITGASPVMTIVEVVMPNITSAFSRFSFQTATSIHASIIAPAHDCTR
jgi:hypothetical protein